MFTIRNIKFDLSEKGIQSAIDQVNEIKDKIKPAMHALINWLTERGVEVARINIWSFERPAYYYGDLYNSLESIPCTADGIGKISTSCPYAMYVEFGTGLVGQNSPQNPEAKDVGTFREDGWIYFNERDGRWHLTYGMEPRPFMYRTYRDMQDQAARFGGRIVAEYLAKGV